MNDKILYSPWRLNYILEKKSEGCIFCLSPSSDDHEHLIVYRSELCFVIMNLYPYNNGHLMVVPYAHKRNFSELTQDEITDIFLTVQLSERILRKTYNPEGVNIGINLGRAAGAGIDDHLHVHLVPRWNGDTNFMTTIGGTRVIPEAFDRAYTQLKRNFDDEKK